MHCGIVMSLAMLVALLLAGGLVDAKAKKAGA